ncbi:hypothetical protein CAPTEDRAFT_224571 [Capitella teleta]|uniref:Thioesterase domain-containing protein n=1 Tax=Capitella teleta TaxID=283909 RepID=R7VA57_CAPTE|nr:hypothetical protein CAPTEDRAFT_224571 [Capitella teleta]|eukprot:ELU15422.1 hypothetical protein CAPTEDRAFT_224571 [Capitella teleta]
MDPRDMPIMKVCQETMASEITLPGFGFSDLDPEKRISFFAMAKLGEASRVFSYNYSTGVVPYRKLMGKGALIFVKSCYYEIFPDFFDIKHQFKPVKCISQLQNLGNTSYQHHTKLISTPMQAVLFSCVVTVVRVDKVTRRPVPIPDEFVQSVGQKLRTCHVPKMKTMSVPKECLKVDFIANWADCDGYKHVNQSSYLRFCQSAAEQLEWSKMLPGYNSSSVRTIQALHSGETTPGQKLTASVWKEGQTLCFDLFNESTENTVYQAAFGTQKASHL